MPDLLRETFEAYADRAPSADGLRTAVESRVRRRRAWQRVYAAGVAVATAAAVVAGVAVLDRPARRAPGLTMPPAPAGTSWFSHHGVEVAVPAAWLTGKVWCGYPQEDAVVVFGHIRLACAPKVPPHLDVLRVGGAPKYQFDGKYEERDDTVDGVAVRRMVGRNAEGQYVEALDVPAHATSLTVSTDDPAVARRVLDTVRVLDVDFSGCVAHQADLYASPPAREDAVRTMVPSGFTDASVCGYVDGWVVRSRLLDGDGAEEVATALDALPPGFGDPSPRSEDDEVARGRAILVTFRYPSGPPVTVAVHTVGTREIGASNGAVTGHPTDGLTTLLLPGTSWNDLYWNE